MAMDESIRISRKQLETLYRHLSGLQEATGILRSVLLQDRLTKPSTSAMRQTETRVSSV